MIDTLGFLAFTLANVAVIVLAFRYDDGDTGKRKKFSMADARSARSAKTASKPKQDGTAPPS